jgi:F420-dependent oxidoreductase-like protein
MRFVAPCLVILAGPSGAGKSTWAAATFTPNQVVASDDLRAMAGIDDADQQASPDAFFLLDEIVRRRLARNLTTVVDTLGYDAERRARHTALARDAGMPVYVVAFDTPADVCRARNEARARPIPKSVLTKQISAWRRVRPQLDQEGYDGLFTVSEEGVPASVVAASMEHAAEAAVRQREEPARLHFGLHVSSFTWPEDVLSTRERLAAIAQAAEAAGFSSMWVMDHFRQIPQVGRPWEPMLESYTTLAFLAGVTDRLQLGALVTGVTYRHPALLGKMLATLDVLSGGRALCGLGIGWFEQEARAYGWEWPPVSDRYALLEDTLRLLPLLWGPGSKPFAGNVISVPETICYPRPVQERIPILVGGSGERKTLRLVAEYADLCNLFGDPATIAHKVDVLRRHCADVGRDPAEITVSVLTTALVADDADHLSRLVERLRPPGRSSGHYMNAVNAGTVDDQIGRLRRYAEAGVQYAVVGLSDGFDPAAVERFGRVIDAFR